MSQYAHPEVLVDTQWLMNHLKDSNVRVVEVDMSVCLEVFTRLSKCPQL